MKNGVEKWSIGNDLHTNGKQDFFIWDQQNGATRFLIDSIGRTGVGTSSPTYKLDINSGSLNGFQVKTTHGTTNYGYCIRANVDNNLTKALVVDKSDTTNFVVYGNGTVYAREVYVKLGSLGDFVFNDDYKLKSISQLEKYIEKNKHLPGIPSADEISQNDLNVGEFQNLLLQKVEEQALYIISLQKQIDELKVFVEKIGSKP